ncbi:MAG TPA: glycosyltransferase, partial [Rhodospirillaceae bacterium]|nr:glycosyltransferase [Rhodospirillaceae bacterium]
MNRKKPEDTRSPATVSVVATAFNEQENLEALCDEIRRALAEEYRELEILIVDNGSTDQSLNTLKMLRSQDDRIGFVSLSRNFGHQGGLIAGLEHCSGEVIVTMDADLQHPPEVIPQLLDHWKNGIDVVGTIRAQNPDTPRLRRLLNLMFYAMIRRMMGTLSPASHSDFRLMDRRALDVLLALPEKDKFLRGLTSWIGFPQTTVSYAPRERSAGKSKLAFKH